MKTRLAQCTTIEDVVELINDEMATDATAEQLAANYALDAIHDALYGDDVDQIEYHLDALVLFGAEFNYIDALTIALKS